jgi:CRISPR/Cas system-associated exonuclease Cas4 (RecB family)
MEISTLAPGFIFSQSSLQDYSDCPRRFQLRYMDLLQWPAVESEPAMENERRQQAGRLFHRLVQQYFIGVPAEKILLQVSSPDLQRWWENFTQNPIDLQGYIQHTELTLSTPLGGNFRLIAKYDLVAIKPGIEIIVFDWKTYAKHPRDEFLAARWQTRIYRALMIQAGTLLFGGSSINPAALTMMYWFAEYPTQPARFPYTAAQYKRDTDALDKLVNEIASAKEFPKTDEEKKCSYCVYRSFCDRKVIIGDKLFLEDDPVEPEINLEQIQEIAF